MFSLKIVDTDRFLDMPLTTQSLYFHLGMRADDDGFVGNQKRIMRLVGCGEDDMKLLIAKQFIIAFESGICVITDWGMQNKIQKDRYQASIYHEEKALLCKGENNEYLLNQQNVNNVLPQVSIVEDSIVKVSKEKRSPSFKKPTIAEIETYCKERNNGIDAQRFYDYYEVANWTRGKTKIKNWKACVRTWESTAKQYAKDKKPTGQSETNYSKEDTDNMITELE